jgi:hypothetical protein
MWDLWWTKQHSGRFSAFHSGGPGSNSGEVVWDLWWTKRHTSRFSVFHSGGQGSNPGEVMWDLWWTKRHWSRFSPNTSVSSAKHSTDCYTLTIILAPLHLKGVKITSKIGSLMSLLLSLKKLKLN